MALTFEDRRKRDIKNITTALEFGCMQILTPDFNSSKRMYFASVPSPIKEAIDHIASAIDYNTGVAIGGKISAHLVRTYNEDITKSPLDLAISALDKSAVPIEVITKLRDNNTVKVSADAIKASFASKSGRPAIPVRSSSSTLRRTSASSHSASGRS